MCVCVCACVHVHACVCVSVHACMCASIPVLTVVLLGIDGAIVLLVGNVDKDSDVDVDDFEESVEGISSIFILGQKYTLTSTPHPHPHPPTHNTPTGVTLNITL